MLFDAPDGNVTCTRRIRSNTPLQSLTLANGVQFIECAQSLAQSVIDSEAAIEDRLESTFRRCLTRSPSKAELGRLRQLWESQRAAFSSNPKEAELLAAQDSAKDTVEAATWVATIRVLMNS